MYTLSVRPRRLLARHRRPPRLRHVALGAPAADMRDLLLDGPEACPAPRAHDAPAARAVAQRGVAARVHVPARRAARLDEARVLADVPAEELERRAVRAPAPAARARGRVAVDDLARVRGADVRVERRGGERRVAAVPLAAPVGCGRREGRQRRGHYGREARESRGRSDGMHRP
jgi:hypothetical protein